MSSAQTPLQEGIDYVIESGLWVFTALHHQKRGICCESGCRNCPYGNSPADQALLISCDAATGNQHAL